MPSANPNYYDYYDRENPNTETQCFILALSTGQVP